LAGLGRKVFNSGDILLASEVQGYLQDQAVMVFDDAAARGSAIGTANFSEGMVTYTKDDDAIQVYDGSAFVGVGSDSGLIHIETVSFSAVSAISVNDVFSADYDRYLILPNFKMSTDSFVQLRLRVSGSDNSTNNYWRQFIFASASSISATRAQATQIDSFEAGTTYSSSGRIVIENPFKIDYTRGEMFVAQNNLTTQGIVHLGFLFNLTSSFDGFSLIANSGTATGSISVYGYKD
jgi:hypothetical protein